MEQHLRLYYSKLYPTAVFSTHGMLYDMILAKYEETDRVVRFSDIISTIETIDIYTDTPMMYLYMSPEISSELVVSTSPDVDASRKVPIYYGRYDVSALKLDSEYFLDISEPVLVNHNVVKYGDRFNIRLGGSPNEYGRNDPGKLFFPARGWNDVDLGLAKINRIVKNFDTYGFVGGDMCKYHAPQLTTIFETYPAHDSHIVYTNLKTPHNLGHSVVYVDVISTEESRVVFVCENILYDLNEEEFRTKYIPADTSIEDHEVYTPGNDAIYQNAAFSIMSLILKGVESL